MSNKDERLKTLFQVPVTNEIKGSKIYYEKIFYSICSELMLNYDLCIKSKNNEEIKRYDLLEVESYFKSEKYHHNDPYTHNHPIQYKNGLWYFHHMGQSSAFKGGTRKGVDITLGKIEYNNNQEQRVASGGILIRAVQCQKTQKLIEGPSLLVDNILKELGYSTLKDLVTNQFDKNKISGHCWDQKSGFFIAPKVTTTNTTTTSSTSTISTYFKKKKDTVNQDHSEEVEEENAMDYHINTSCRVGLGLKNRSPSLEIRLDYVCRPYRYTKKTWLLSKGKVWTLLSLLRDNYHKKKHSNNNKYSAKLNIKSTLMKSCQSEFEYGINHAASVIKSCLLGKDIIEGNLGWKIKVMSAILWREDQLIKGKKVVLDI